MTGFVPIAMYVYNRPHYLRQVLSSLRAARGVDGVLLVVSTDACIETMVHEVMRATEFVAGVRLLFHPYPPRLFGPVGGRGGDGVGRVGARIDHGRGVVVSCDHVGLGAGHLDGRGVDLAWLASPMRVRL